MALQSIVAFCVILGINKFGKRDYAILLVLIRTGMRVSELVCLNIDNIEFGRITKVNLLGKGRKERSVPLLDDVDTVLRNWIVERAEAPTASLFIGRGGFRLSRDNIERIVKKYAQMAEQNCPSIRRKRVTPHVLRHTAAMDWRRNNIDSMTIANLLGHESLQTTSVYLHADIELKKRELDRLGKIDPRYSRFSPDEKLLSFLDGL